MEMKTLLQKEEVINSSMESSTHPGTVDHVEMGPVPQDHCPDGTSDTSDAVTVDNDKNMETEASVKCLLDQEKEHREGSSTSPEPACLEAVTTESFSAEVNSAVLQQEEIILLRDNVLHQENVLQQDSSAQHQINVVLQDKSVLYQDNTAQPQDNAGQQQDNVVLQDIRSVLNQDRSTQHEDSAVLHQPKSVLEDEIGVLQDTIVLVQDTAAYSQQQEECSRTVLLDQQDLGNIQQTNMMLDNSVTAVHSEVLMTDEEGGMQISQDSGTVTAGSPKTQQECSGCKKSIIDRFLLKAMDQYWHEDCLKCSCCDCRLGEVGSTLFAKANLLLCRRDYLRLFGTTGYCSACSKMIPAFEMVMRAKNNVYHLECFACQMCNHRFCVGDRFYLCDNKILCEYDYEERMVFANMTYNYNALSQIKRQTNSLSDDLSSGYGSPSPGSL